MKTKKITSSFLILALLVSLIALPIDTKAKTIKEFENEVNNYTKQLEEKKSKLAKNDAEVAQIKKKISQIESEIKTVEQEVETLQEEIDKSNEQIKQKSEESKKIIEYYQVSNGDNAYLEYAFGATSITDMIYRLSVVEQLTEYNDNLMKELENLIAENEKKQEELAGKKQQLKDLKKSLESEKERINADSASIKDTMPALEEQIKAAKANVTYYKNLGCGPTEDIQKCQYRIEQSNNSSSGGSIPSANGFFRPMEYGYIVRGFSWNNVTASGVHMGYDLSASDKRIPIYPIADGQVFAKFYDNAGALVVKVKHDIGGKYIYSTYAHFSSFGNISVGQNISYTTMIGRMGSTGNSSGPHLHIEITDCDWNKGGGCTWAEYQHRLINPNQYIELPFRWTNR